MDIKQIGLKLQEYKSALDELKQERTRAQARLDMNNEKLKEFGVSSIAEAQKKLGKLETERIELIGKITAIIDKIEQEYFHE